MTEETLYADSQIPLDSTTLALPVSRRATDLLLTLSGLLLAQMAVWLIRPTFWGVSGGPWSWALLGLGALFGGAGLRRMERWLPDRSPQARPLAVPQPRRQKFGVAALILALGLVTWVVLQLWPDYRQWQGTLLPWLLALTLVIAGGLLVRRVGESSGDYAPALLRNNSTLNSNTRNNNTVEAATAQHQEQFHWPRPFHLYETRLGRAVEILLFLLILVLAAFLRVYRLDEIPAAIYVDETNAALDALSILEGRGDSPFGTGWYETPSGYSYYMAALFNFFGANYLTLKAASLIPALLTIPAIYLLGRYLFGSAAGLAAMFLLAISRWHMTLSRWGWNELMPPLFQIMATFFLIRGLRERRALDYAVGGLLTGLMLYTYLSSRLAVLTLGIFILYWLATEPAGLSTAIKRLGTGIALFAGASIIAAAPLGVTYATQPFLFFNRANEISIFKDVQQEGSWWPLRENILRHVRLFYQEGDPVGRQNLPGEPQTDPITGMLLAVGMGYALLNLRDRRRGLLILWLLIALAGGFLSEIRVQYAFAPDYVISPNSYRTLSAMIAVALTGGDVVARLGYGFYHFWQHPGYQRWINTAVGLALILPILGFAAAWEIGLFFGRQANSVEVQTSFNQIETKVAYAVLDALEAGATVYLSPNFYNFSPLRFLVYETVRNQTGVNPLVDPPFYLARPEVDLPIPATEGGVLYLLDTHYAAVTDYIKTIYPNAKIDEIKGTTNTPLFLSIWISAADLRVQQGLMLTTTHGDGSSTVERTTDLAFSEDKPIQRRVWHGSLRLETSGLYHFHVENARLEIDDESWGLPRYLGRGLHTLALTQEGAQATTPPQLHWQTPDGTAGPIPSAAFFVTAPPQHGLTGLYYANERWEGTPLLRQVTPFLLLAWPPNEPLPHPFSASFIGSLQIDDAGFYNFRLSADDGVRFILNGNILGEMLVPDQPNQIRVALDLAPGLYPLRIDYFQRYGGSALEFFWQPPGQFEQPVPPSVLILQGAVSP